MHFTEFYFETICKIDTDDHHAGKVFNDSFILLEKHSKE